MSAKLISSTIAKAAIAEFLGLPKSTRVSKDVLIEKLLALLEINPEAKAQFEENHVKFLRGIKYSDVYATRREAWYRRKNEAMQVLAQTPYAKLTFYRPENPHKESLYLCDEHYEMKREGFYETKWDFFADHAKEIAKCPHCFYQREKDYYSLYHLEITVPAFPELRFSFHMPNPGKLPKVDHIEQDGLFRFGRQLFTQEKITHREQDVLVNFEQALAEVKRIYCVDTVHEAVEMNTDEGGNEL